MTVFNLEQNLVLITYILAIDGALGLFLIYKRFTETPFIHNLFNLQIQSMFCSNRGMQWLGQLA